MAAPTMEKVTTAKMMEKTTVRITDRRERSLTVGRTTGRQIPEMVLRPKKLLRQATSLTLRYMDWRSWLRQERQEQL